MTWTLVLTKHAAKDAKKLKNARLWNKAEQLLQVIINNPYQNPPPYEKPVGDLEGFYSRRINIQHRLVYEALEEIRVIKVLRMWTHYE